MSCGCSERYKCKSCSYINPTRIPRLDYDYWNQTVWLNRATVDGWGATLGETNQGLSTGDNLSGYGISSSNSSGGSSFIKYIYEYDGRVYESGSKLLYINNRWTPVHLLGGVKRRLVYNK
jgi:hypothetical protein